MKRILVAIMMMLPIVVVGQNHQYTADTAVQLVDGYLQKMGIAWLSSDSMIVAETVVTYHGYSDTTRMKRWYSPSHKHRVEVYEKGELNVGFFGNGLDVFKAYDTKSKTWALTGPTSIYDPLTGYDLRGPLYEWHKIHAQLEYKGRVKTDKGAELRVVLVRADDRYPRFYMFDEEGLLTIIQELESDDEKNIGAKESHIDWKFEHEYQPMGRYLLPSLESFMRDGVITILETSYRIEPLDNRIFEQEK